MILISSFVFSLFIDFKNLVLIIQVIIHKYSL